MIFFKWPHILTEDWKYKGRKGSRYTINLSILHCMLKAIKPQKASCIDMINTLTNLDVFV